MEKAAYIKKFLQLQSEFLAYLMVMTRNLDAAEEVFQNAAVVVLEKIHAGEQFGDFRAWTKEVIRRQALLYLRKNARNQTTDPKLLEQITRTFMEDDSTEDQTTLRTQALEHCLGQLPEDHLQMVALRYEKRFSFDQIGRHINRTGPAVQRALCRIRKTLRDGVCMRLTTFNENTPDCEP